MPRWNRSLLYLAALLGLCSLLTGCQSFFAWWNGSSSQTGPPPTPPMFGQRSHGASPGGMHTTYQRGVLGPRSEVSWSLESPGQPGPLMTGQSVVGPDGTLVLGPYGTFPVAGMTLAQASATIEKKLRGQVNQPRVKLQAVHSPADGAASVVRPGTAQPPAPMPPALTQPSSPKPGEMTWQSSAITSPRQKGVLTTA